MTARLTISQPRATPGEVVTISGRTLSPKRASVVLSDAAGREILVAATAAGRHTIAFAVPPFLDTEHFRIAAGAVRVSVVEGSSRKRQLVLEGFEIADLPPVVVAPGTLTVMMLDQLANLADLAIERWQRIEDASYGGVNTRELRAGLLDVKQQCVAAKALFDQLMTGAVTQVSVGEVGGHPVVLDLSSLALIDRLYAAYLFQGHPPGASLKHQRVLGPGSAPDLTQALADQFQQLIGSDIPAEVADFAKRYQRAGNAVIAVATLGLVVATGEITIPLAAGAALGGLLWNAVTWVPAAQMAALEGGSHLMIEDEVSFKDFRQSTAFLKDQIVNRLISTARKQFTDELTGRQGAGAIANYLWTLAKTTMDTWPSMTRPLRRNFRHLQASFRRCPDPSRPVDCSGTCCPGAIPACNANRRGCYTPTTTTTVPFTCQNPSSVPCEAEGFCCAAGSVCNRSGCCGGQFPVPCGDYCCGPGGVCGQGNCTDPCPPDMPVACGNPLVCCAPGSVCGIDCNTSVTTTTLPGVDCRCRCDDDTICTRHEDCGVGGICGCPVGPPCR